MIQAELEESLSEAHAELALLKAQQREHVRTPATRREFPGNEAEAALHPPAKKLKPDQPTTPSPTASSARGPVQPRPGTAASFPLFSVQTVVIDTKYGPLFQNFILQALPDSEGAKQARLRRLCERKPTGKLQCPEWLRNQWKNPANRPSLVEKFEAQNWNKDWVCTLITSLFMCTEFIVDQL